MKKGHTSRIIKDQFYNRNPTGKGGFNDHPEHRGSGIWQAKNSLTYQYRMMMGWSIEEFEEFGKIPKKEMTVAQRTAYLQLKNLVVQHKDENVAIKTLPIAIEVENRISGKPVQPTEQYVTVEDVLTNEDVQRIESAIQNMENVTKLISQQKK